MNAKRFVRGQSGPELMIVYAFVVLSLGLTFILLYNMGAFSSLLDRTCAKDVRGFSSLNPVDWAVYYSNSDVKAHMRNDAGMTIEVTGGFVSLDRGVNCTTPPGGNPIFLGPGESVTLNLSCNPKIYNELSEGACFAAPSVFNFTNVESGKLWQSKGTFRGEIEKSR